MKRMSKYCIATIIRDNDKITSELIVEFKGPDKKDIKSLLEKIVKTYLESPEGTQYNLSINSDFNWGDAFTIIPEKYFRWEGITNIKTYNPIFTFEHDENLFDKLLG